jgi:hypothetical protein
MHRAIIPAGQPIRDQATIMGCADSFTLLLVAALAITMLRKGAEAGGAPH